MVGQVKIVKNIVVFTVLYIKWPLRPIKYKNIMHNPSNILKIPQPYITCTQIMLSNFIATMLYCGISVKQWLKSKSHFFHRAIVKNIVSYTKLLHSNLYFIATILTLLLTPDYSLS